MPRVFRKPGPIISQNGLAGATPSANGDPSKRPGKCDGKAPSIPAANLKAKGVVKSSTHDATTPRSHLNRIAERFEDFQRSGKGYKARCPAHDDSNPSLSINEGEDGRILIHCHAGCPIADVLEVVGLTLADLQPGAKLWPKPIATYDYRDADGTLLYQSLRYDPKDFKCRRPDGTGGWVWKGVFDGVERVPYRLSELLAADLSEPVFIVEGEKDADRVAEMELTATTNIGGAGKWRPEYNKHFAGRHVVLLPDNDDPGREHMADVLRNLGDIPESVKWLELPGLPEKGDVSNWADVGGTREKLLGMVKQTTPLPISVIKIISVPPHESTSGAGENPVIKIIPVTPPELGEAAYHGLVGEFLRQVAEYTEATDAGVLAHLLPAAGMLIGPGPHHFAGNIHPARINTVLVGPTSIGRKGTAFHPVDLLMKRTDAKFWSRQRVDGGLSSGEGLIQFVADQHINDEHGNEKIVEVEKRFYVVEQEFSRVFGNMSREGNVLNQVIRQAFDSGELATLTVNPRRATGAHICITGHITEMELAERLNHIDMANGFANRFLWFVVRSDKVIPRSKPIPETVGARLVKRLKEVALWPSKRAAPMLKKPSLAEYLKAKGVAKPNVPFSEDADARWANDVYPKLRQPSPGVVGELVARNYVMVVRLALIYALLDDKFRDAIEPDHLEAALAVWAYCEESVAMLFDKVIGDKLCDKLLKLLEGGPMTKDDFNKHLSAQQKAGVNKALEKLEARNLVKKTKVKHEGAGRPATRWELVG
jgi:hypothetical protein